MNECYHTCFSGHDHQKRQIKTERQRQTERQTYTKRERERILGCYLCILYQNSCKLFHSFIHSGYFYSASSNLLLFRGTPDYSIDTVSKLTRRNATGNCK